MRAAARVLTLVLGLVAQAAKAQEPTPDCDTLRMVLGGVGGYEPAPQPAVERDGWCVLDDATLRSYRAGWPNLTVKQVQLRRGGDAEAPWIELALTGLRAAPRVGDDSVDSRLRALFRLQSADLWLVAVHNVPADQLDLRVTDLRLSGGTYLALAVSLRGAGLDPATLAGASVTRLDLDWRNDGRLLRPVMEIAGERLSGAAGLAAVDAARAVLAQLVAALPPSVLPDEPRTKLERLVAALPQGRGRLNLSLDAPDGIGAARLGIAALSRDPLGPESLARLFARTEIKADWQPGIAP